MNKKPKRTKPEHVKCVICKKPIHIDDLGIINNKGMYHKNCYFKIYYQDPFGFLTGFEAKAKEHKIDLKDRE
jgi:hypothetical protein